MIPTVGVAHPDEILRSEADKTAHAGLAVLPVVNGPASGGWSGRSRNSTRSRRVPSCVRRSAMPSVSSP
jgi:hypothetical protein